MHYPSKNLIVRRKQAASEKGRRMANARWKNERARQDAIAAADPLRVTGRIIRRIVVIDEERAVREAVIYDFDSIRSARSKLRNVLACGDQSRTGV